MKDAKYIIILFIAMAVMTFFGIQLGKAMIAPLESVGPIVPTDFFSNQN